MKMNLTGVALLVATSAKLLAAQSVSLASAADSADAGRAAWRAAVVASRAHDTLAMRREIERAAASWPRQQLYVWNRAVLAAARNDSATLRAALADYARLGLGRDLSDSVFDRFRNRAWFEALAREHAANRRPIVNSNVVASLADSTLWPEGMDYDSVSGKFYVGSIRHRTIVEVSPGGRERELLPRDRVDVGAVMGVRVDGKRGRLWATIGGMPQMQGFVAGDTAIAALLEMRLSDGKILRRWNVPPNRSHALGDLALAPNGDVLVTDSNDPVIYRLRRGADSLESFRHRLFHSLQGVAPIDDNTAYVADYSLGLLRVDFRSGDVIRLDDSHMATTLGCDGIALYRGSIIAVQNGVSPPRVMRFYLDSAGTRITGAEVLDRNIAVADEPTIGAIAGDQFVYVANSQWEKYDDNGTLKPGARLKRPVLLGVTLQTRPAMAAPR